MNNIADLDSILTADIDVSAWKGNNMRVGHDGKSTIYIQHDMDVTETMAHGYCDSCLIPLSEVYEENRYGHLEVYGAFDDSGDLYGFFCPDCAKSQESNADTVILLDQ